MDHSQFGLGRLNAPDARDMRFLMSSLPAAAPKPPKPRKYPYRLGSTQFQGNTPRCVGFSGRHKLTAAPIMVKSGPEPEVLYRGAQDYDEWPGNDYDGTSVRGLFKWLTANGYIQSYVWATSAKDCHDFLRAGWGTIIAGTEWTSKMFEPDAQGFVHPEGASEGGHAYHLFWSVERGNAATSELWFQNSWDNWGIVLNRTVSCFKMTWDAFDHLLQADGEAGAGIERKVKAA